MEKEIDWKDTFFDKDVWSTAFERLGSKTNVILYFVSIIMYIVCFVFLFQKGTSEYIAYVLVFIVNAIFPFLWIKDFRDFISRVDFSQSSKAIFGVDMGTNIIYNLMFYREWGIYLALFFQFIALFLVVLKNENVRKMKTINEKDSESRPKQKDLETNNKVTEQNDKTILALFVTITTILWSLLGDTFAFPINENSDTNKSFFQSESYTYLMRAMKWLTSQPYRILENIDNGWLYYMNKISTTPLIKAFSMYCVIFFVIFFGVFVRIPQRASRNPSDFARMERFNIINMESPFPAKFERNIDDYRCLAISFFCIFLIFIFVLVMYGIYTLSKKYIPKIFLQAGVPLGSILFIACLFGDRKNAFPTSYSVKNLIFFLLSVLFGLTGTPVVLSILQLLMDAGLFTSLYRLFALPYYLYKKRTDTDGAGLFTSLYRIFMTLREGFNRDELMKYKVTPTLNKGSSLTILSIIIFIILTLTIYSIGLGSEWLKHANVDGKSFMMFLVVLICMSISLFMALSTSFPILSSLFTFFHKIAQIVLLFIAPLAIFLFAIVQFALSLKNHNKYKIYEKIDKRLKSAAA